MKLNNFINKNKKTLQILAGIVIVALLVNHFLAWPPGNQTRTADVGEGWIDGYDGAMIRCLSASGSSDSAYIEVQTPWGTTVKTTVYQRVTKTLTNPNNPDEKYNLWPIGISDSGVYFVVWYDKPASTTPTAVPTSNPTSNPTTNPTSNPTASPTQSPNQDVNTNIPLTPLYIMGGVVVILGIIYIIMRKK